ncbi:hypothetical protein [Micromonospora sediminicola]|uniref:hypothetical protein n=1 Tax=Micromonospora sediminicola TaxID=946078 RepID=UPI0037BD1269
MAAWTPSWSGIQFQDLRERVVHAQRLTGDGGVGRVVQGTGKIAVGAGDHEQLPGREDHGHGHHGEPGQPVGEQPAGGPGPADRGGDHAAAPGRPQRARRPQEPQEGHGQEDQLPPVVLPELAGAVAGGPGAERELGDENGPQDPTGDGEHRAERLVVDERLGQDEQQEEQPQDAHRLVQPVGEAVEAGVVLTSSPAGIVAHPAVAYPRPDPGTAARDTRDVRRTGTRTLPARVDTR